jgi:hypothetical protein
MDNVEGHKTWEARVECTGRLTNNYDMQKIQKSVRSLEVNA